MAPIERRGQEKYEAVFDEIRRSGFVRMRVDGKSFNVDEPPDIDHRRKHLIEVVVDRLIVRTSQRSRFADAVETALDLGKGVMHVAHVDDDARGAEVEGRSLQPAFRLRPVRPQLRAAESASFFVQQPARLVPGVRRAWARRRGPTRRCWCAIGALTLRQGALTAWPELTPEQPFTRFAEALARHGGFSLDMPWAQLDAGASAAAALRHGRGMDYRSV